MNILIAGDGPLADGILEFMLQLEWAVPIGLIGKEGPAVDRARQHGVRVSSSTSKPPTNADILVAAQLPADHHHTWSQATRLGGVHVHLSLLPRHRGVAPVRWAVLGGDAESGISIHYITDTAYEGNILAQEKLEIKPAHNVADLVELLRGSARDMVVKVLHALAKIGPLPGTPQDGEPTENAQPPDAELSHLDFTQPMDRVHRQVQAFCHPHGGARSATQDAPLRVWRAVPLLPRPPKPPKGAKPPKDGEERKVITALDFVLPGRKDKPAGTVLSGPDERFGVACGCGGVLELLELQTGDEPYAPLPPQGVLQAGQQLAAP